MDELFVDLCLYPPTSWDKNQHEAEFMSLTEKNYNISSFGFSDLELRKRWWKGEVLDRVLYQIQNYEK